MSRPSLLSHDHPLYPIHIGTNVIVTTFLAIFSAVATMISNANIQGELALSHTESIWVTTLYLLGVNTIVPTGNWFASRFGYNRMYTLGIVVFTLATLFAALATNFWMIASARFIEGVGAGFIFPIGLALIVKSVAKEKISLAINLYIAIAFGGGLGLGIWIAGHFAQFYSWRDIFFMIVPFGMIATISCWMSRKLNPELKKTPFDFFGFLTFALFVSSLLVALTLGPIRSTPEGWRTPYIIILFFIALLSITTCLWIESRHPNPIIPLKLFKNPIFSVSLAAMFLIGMAIFSGLSVSVNYMLEGLSYERFIVGRVAMVYGLTIGIVSVCSSYLAKKIPIPLLTFSGLCLLIFSYFYGNELSWLTGYKQVIGILFLRGVGIGLALGPTTALALYGIAQEMQSSAATILTFFRQVGGTYGGTLIAIFSIRRTIFHTARFAEQTNEHLPSYQFTLQKLLDKFPDPTEAKLAIIKNLQTQALIQGMNDASLIFGYLTSIVAFFLFGLILYRSWKRRKKSTGTSS